MLAAAMVLASAAGAIAHDACHLETISDVKAVTVLDGRTIAFEDGREARLTGLQIPNPYARAAKDALTALIAGQPITLKRSGSFQDRYGRLIVFAFAKDHLDRSLNSTLLSGGYARMMPSRATEGCAAPLLEAEAEARAAQAGLWSDRAFHPLEAGDRARILAERGRFALVEGKVLSVHEAGKTIYVNFGRHWSRDFSIVILKRYQRAFSAAGVEPKALDHRHIRVRGIIERRGGPIIEAEHPEQIEIVDQYARVMQ